MNGADALVQASANAGVEVCFANAGTTEMTMVDALDRAGSIRAVPVLFEGVASGAADGYARIAGKPASTMLHLGPGLANASANLHNARRARSPVVNWVGDHTTWLVPHDPPLHSDIDSLARMTSRWIGRTESAEQLAQVAVEAVAQSYGPVGGVATLIAHADHLEAELKPNGRLPEVGVIGPAYEAVDGGLIEKTATALAQAQAPLILLGGHGTDARSLQLAARAAESVGATVRLEQFPRCVRREVGLPAPERLAYMPFQARLQLKRHDLIVCVGTESPVSFFGYAGQEPLLSAPDALIIDPTSQGRSRPLEVLEHLADTLNAPRRAQNVARPREIREPHGKLNADTTARTLGLTLPENAIVVGEGISSSLPLYPGLEGMASHDFLTCKGGSIGYGIPASVGAAIATPHRRVITYVGDGSAAYTIQGLWTQARESLNVTTIVLVNRQYAVLRLELLRLGAKTEGVNGDLTDIGRPDLDYVQIAQGFGVPATAVTDVAALRSALKRSFDMSGPSLIAAIFG